MAKVLGIVKIKVEGRLMRSKQGATLQVGGLKATSSVGFKRYGYFNTFEPSQITATFAKTSDLDVIGLKALRSGTLQFEGDDGITYLVPNVDCTEGGQISDNDGGVSFTFEGDPAEVL